MDKLVFIESENINEEPYTTDEIIAKYSGNEVKSVKKLITTYKNDLGEFGILRFQIAKPLKGSKGGRPSKGYLLNEQQATLLITYLDNTEKVRQFKKTLVKQFYAMKKVLFERHIERNKGTIVCLSMTDEIKRSGFTKGYHYSNFTRLAYKSAIGFSSTDIRKAREVPSNGVIADYLTADELQAVNAREQQIATLLTLGMDYKQIQGVLSNQGVIYQATLKLKEKV